MALASLSEMALYGARYGTDYKERHGLDVFPGFFKFGTIKTFLYGIETVR